MWVATAMASIMLSGLAMPFLRVSVDHGTAFDRAWKGIANPESMIEAIAVATHMLGARRG